MKKSLPGVSAVIPTFNGKNRLFRLLKSLKDSNYPKLEVIVVDNSPAYDVMQEGKKKYKWVKWIYAGEKNIGQTGCYNLGFAHAKRKNHILCVDDDVVVDKDMILKLVEASDFRPDIGIVIPMILYLSDKNWVNQAGANVNLITGKVTVGWGLKKNFLQAKEVQNSGTVMLYLRSVIDKIGGFEDWFLCYFDPEYCLRAKKAGFITWYTPEAVAYHDQSKDPNIWRPRVLTRAYLLGRNRVLFMRKHGNIFTFTLFIPFLLTYYLIETVRFGQLNKFFEMVFGTIVGFWYPLNNKSYIPLPKIRRG
ncbi:MAG: glycosyltransferase family 2 protein [Patescibacteria group bacterium]